MREIGRQLKLLRTFENYHCEICCDAEAHHLIWFPHQKKIKHNIMRYGRKTKEFQEAIKLIEESFPVCLHCNADREYRLIVGDDHDPRWPF